MPDMLDGPQEVSPVWKVAFREKRLLLETVLLWSQQKNLGYAMTKTQAQFLMAKVSERYPKQIRKVRRKHIVFESRYWALAGYRYLFQNFDCPGMYMLGGDQIIYFPWRRR